VALERLELLDPTAERSVAVRPLAPRLPAEVTGQRVALLDIRKPRGDVFLDQLEELLVARGYEVERTAKATFTKPAAADLRRDIAERCGAVIEALAD
jgi:hypothetical protein